MVAKCGGVRCVQRRADRREQSMRKRAIHQQWSDSRFSDFLFSLGPRADYTQIFIEGSAYLFGSCDVSAMARNWFTRIIPWSRWDAFMLTE